MNWMFVSGFPADNMRFAVKMRFRFTGPFLFLCLLNYFSISEGIIEKHPIPTYQQISPEQLKSYLTELLTRNASLRDCPAPRLPLHEEDCKVTTCSKDQDCPSRNQSCCFNGCLFTCVERMSPPPVIDWDDEVDAPPLRKIGEAVLRCTTSPRPAPSEPVGCPKGYTCKIEDYGDPLERRYNSGVCVPISTSEEVTDSDYLDSSGLKEKKSKQTVYLPGGCVLSEGQFNDMKDFMTRSYVKECLCIDGSVECKITP